MIINTKVVINRPREQVWEYFDNADNITKWIKGLDAYHHMIGDSGSIGAVGLYEFREDGLVIEMKDEILARKEPEEFSSKFHHKDFDMVINYSFFEESNSTTTLLCNTQYVFRNTLWALFSKMTCDKIQQRQNENLRQLKKLVELEPLI